MHHSKFRLAISCSKTWVYAFALMLVMSSACTTHGREKTDETIQALPSRNALIQTYRKKDHIIFAYGTGDSAAANAYKDILTPFTKQEKYKKVILKPDFELTDEDMQNSPVFLLGMPKNNRILKKLLPKLPFNVTQQTVEFNQHQYGDHPILSIKVFPNPAATKMPLSLLTGIAEEDIIAHLKNQLRNPYYLYSISGWGYQLNDAGQRKVIGFFDEADPKQWKIGGKAHFDFSGEHSLISSNDEFQFYGQQGAFDQTEMDSVANSLSKSWDAIFEAFPPRQPVGQAKIHLFQTAEMKGLAIGDTEPASISSNGEELELVIHPSWTNNEQAAGNRLALRHTLGKASLPIFEDGMAIRFTKQWQYKGWQHWMIHLCKGDQAPTIAELLNAEIYKYESPIYLGGFAAGFCDFLLLEFGNQGFSNIYKGKKGSPKKLIGLEEKWQAYLKAKLNQRKEQGQAENTPRFSSKKGISEKLKGFNFAHEGYQVFNGYISKEATRSLNYLQMNLHNNATALIPYTGMRNINQPGWFGIARGAGSENDESIVHCAWAAHETGMEVMIKPQVWPWDSWTGEVKMNSDKDWELFFDRYYRWIRHYALLAEIHNAEMLCIGVEFSKATLARPDGWRKMINDIRKIYSGKITYAANWGQEFEQCQFWDALDFIGLNCYYPLSNSQQLDQQEIEKGFSKTMDKVGRIAERAGKPVVFTEMGFRSCEKAFQNPHAEADGRPPSNETQANCYKAMIKGLENRPWFQGVLLWKWPAYMDDAQYDPIGFTPLGKPAEGLTKDWFKSLND